MPVNEADAIGPATFAGGVLDRYRHVCAFLDGPPEDDALFDAFAGQGIEQGDRLLYLVDPARSAAPVTRLRRLGYDVGELLGDRRCEVRTWTETYLRGGGFDQAAMLGQLQEMLGGGDRPRVRMIADMGWAGDLQSAQADLIEFEWKANLVHAQHRHVVICTYDRTRFDGSFVIDVLRTHPLVLIGGLLQENPFFVPPAGLVPEWTRSAAR